MQSALTQIGDCGMAAGARGSAACSATSLLGYSAGKRERRPPKEASSLSFFVVCELELAACSKTRKIVFCWKLLCYCFGPDVVFLMLMSSVQLVDAPPQVCLGAAGSFGGYRLHAGSPVDLIELRGVDPRPRVRHLVRLHVGRGILLLLYAVADWMLLAAAHVPGTVGGGGSATA